ncbi:MAG: hypothetical protein AAB373_00845 [Patescibacteria group bacterium]
MNSVSKNFKAAIFDFDGTLTEKGHYEPPHELSRELVRLSQTTPIGFCTGREVKSFELHGLSQLLLDITPSDREQLLKNLFLFAENGAIGYKFDLEKEQFEEFYRVPWPDEFMPKEELKHHLNEAIKDFGKLYDNKHQVIMVMRTNLDHDFHKGTIEEIYGLAASIYDITIKLLKRIAPDYEKYVHVGNSGIGVVIGPANGDKDGAIVRFGEYLKQDRGIKFGENFSEILCVGDSPQPGGNDFHFLNGKSGTVYNVGEYVGDVDILNPVLTDDGQKILHAAGTLALLKKLLG